MVNRPPAPTDVTQSPSSLNSTAPLDRISIRRRPLSSIIRVSLLWVMCERSWAAVGATIPSAAASASVPAICIFRFMSFRPG